MAEDNLFQKLTRLFLSGPVVRRKVRTSDDRQTLSSVSVFQKARHDVYNSVLSSYGQFDRMARMSDFSEMEATPELAAALDIYAEESVAQDERGVILHVYSENRKIKELLETLFYDTLNISFNLPLWSRNLVKYGDSFLFIDVDDEYGIVGAYPIPIAEVEREEGYDPDDPTAFRFRWITRGNTILENWQVAHFRLLDNDAFLPYGTSVLDSARRIWRQLILMEDAMLVYRVIRAPERRVFYIDVGNLPPTEIPNYMEQAKDSLKRQPIIDKTDGRVDLRFNPYSVEEDYFLATRGGDSGTRIDTLAGGQNTAAIEDVEYIQKKLFAALKIPKAYLGFDESIGSKATLAQEDIKFSRTIQRIQQTIISELNKIAMIHLVSAGFEGEDLIDFELRLNNPSSVAQMQKLDLISQKFDIASRAPEGLVDRGWIRRQVFDMTPEEIRRVIKGRIKDGQEDALIAAANSEDSGSEMTGPGEFDSDDLFAADIPDDDADLLTGEPSYSKGTLYRNAVEDVEEEDMDSLNLSLDDDDGPLKADRQIRNVFNEPLKKGKRRRSGGLKLAQPDFHSMVSVGSNTRGQDTSNKPYDRDTLRSTRLESTKPVVTKSLKKFLDQQERRLQVLQEEVGLEDLDDN